MAKPSCKVQLAVDLFNAAAEQIKGKVDFRHTYIDLSRVELIISKQGASEVVKTCPAAMGFAFAAGTTGGPGAFDFKQGDDKGNPFWKLVRNLLKAPNKEQIDCQRPKPILLDTGEMKKPYDWARLSSADCNTGELLDAGVNRSPSAYLNNPAVERRKYKYDVDKEMALLKFVDEEWGPVGSFNWFATHGTSMSSTNSLISRDNKGAAARFMEDWFEHKVSGRMDSVVFEDDGLPRRISNIIPGLHDNHHELRELAASFQSPPGRPATRTSSVARRVRGALREVDRPRFVSAFCQSNCGDVSPNVLGAFCIDTGLPCDFNHSTCGGKNELCYGRGPGYPDEFESTRIIGERQFRKAVDLFNAAAEQIKGKVDFRHTYIDLSRVELTISEQGASEVVKTCPAAMGFAFAAGTTDGPGAFDFKQGDDKGNPFWKLVRNLLKAPNKEQIECQRPKPILLDTGEMKKPYYWAPSILPIQILQVGQFVILSVPGETAKHHLNEK